MQSLTPDYIYMGCCQCVKRRQAAEGNPEAHHSHSYKEAFEEMFPKLVQDLTREGMNDPEISDGMQHLRKVHSQNP